MSPVDEPAGHLPVRCNIMCNGCMQISSNGFTFQPLRHILLTASVTNAYASTHALADFVCGRLPSLSGCTGYDIIKATT